MKISAIIEPEELRSIYTHADLMIFDASSSKHAASNYVKEHLEGAYFVDLNTQLADIKTDYAIGGRHPLPPIENFAKTLSELGITEEKHIVIYDDNNGSNAAARFWWMLSSAGHKKVQVLNGGLLHAKKHHLPLSSSNTRATAPTESYPADHWKLPTVDINVVERVAQDPDYLLIDVRDKDRFDGKTEPIDLIAGHIPSAQNIPFIENLDQDGVFLSAKELKDKYAKIFQGIDPKNIIVHCGSGVTACHTLLALDYAGLEIPNLYVGSWSEWSRNNKTIAKSKDA